MRRTIFGKGPAGFKLRSAHCLNHDLTASPLTPEDRDAYLEQCWKDLTVENEAEAQNAFDRGKHRIISRYFDYF